jgi:dienelactone hydrolase
VKKPLLLLACLSFFFSTYAAAAMKTQPVEWKVDGKAYSGFIVYDDASAEKRPGLLMVPDWLGINDASIAKAKQQAGRDYVVLLVDMYGKGVHPKNDQEARAEIMKLYPKPQLMRDRMTAALTTFKAQAKSVPLDTDKIGAFGFCFGGSSVLELARSGAPLAGIVSFHGGLSTQLPAAANSVQTPLLVLNGANDKGVAPDIVPFEKEMDNAGADWQFVNFSGAEHCFALEGKNSEGCKYNERAARRAYMMMHAFFKGRFAATP